jgi:hypothetical protein
MNLHGGRLARAARQPQASTHRAAPVPSGCGPDTNEKRALACLEICTESDGDMPLELEIIRASEFIRLGARGRLDLSASREILKQLAAACRRRGIARALLDLRDVHPGSTPMLTREDLASLVNTFCTVGFSDRQRLVLLYSADPHHRARMFALMTILHGWNVKASENFEEAIHWLSQEHGAEDRKEPGAQEVPVRVTRTSAALARRTRPRQEAGKEDNTPPPRDCRPPTGVLRKVSMKRTPKRSGSRT